MNVVRKILVRIGATTHELDRKVDTSQKKISGFSKQIAKLAPMVAAAFSIRAIVNFTRESIKAYGTQMDAETKLLVALNNKEDAQRRLIHQAKELQKITLFGDEETIAAASLLAQLGLTEKQITRIIPQIQNMAAGLGMDMNTAALLAAKSITTTTDALSRYFGTGLAGTVGQSQRAAVLTDALTKKFDGQAEAVAKVGTGPLTMLNNRYGDLQESVGALLIDGELFNGMIEKTGESVSDLTTFLEALRIQIEKNEGAFPKLIKMFSVILTVANPGIVALKKLIQLGGLWGEKIIETADAQKEANDTITDNTEEVTTNIGKVNELKEELALLDKQYNEAYDPKIIGLINDRKKAIEGELNALSKLTNIPEADIIFPEIDDELVKGWDDAPKLIDHVSESLEKMSVISQLTKMAVSDLFYAFQEAGSSADSLNEFVDNVITASKRIISAYIAEGIAGAVKGALTNVPFPFNIIAAGVAGGAAAAAFNSLVPSFSQGGVVTAPTMAMVGDNPSGKEAIIPLEKAASMGFGNNNGGRFEIVGKVRGKDLYWSLKNYERFLNNT